MVDGQPWLDTAGELIYLVLSSGTLAFVVAGVLFLLVILTIYAFGDDR